MVSDDKSRGGDTLSLYEVWDIQHVRDRFPRIHEGFISQRLARALTRRRQYFRYRADHNDRLKSTLDREQDDNTTVASSLPQHLKYNATPNVGVFHDRVSAASKTSYAPPNMDPGEIRIPSIPGDYIHGPFLCPFCFVFILVSIRHEWKLVDTYSYPRTIFIMCEL